MLKSVGLPLLKKSILKRAGFDINNCSPMRHVAECFVPALFCHGETDDFIDPEHSKCLADKVSFCVFILCAFDWFGKYAGDHNRILVKGGHNTVRPQFLRDSASIFFSQCTRFICSLSFALLISRAGLGLPPIECPPDFSLPVGLNTIESSGERRIADEEDEMAAAIALSLAAAGHDNNVEHPAE